MEPSPKLVAGDKGYDPNLADFISQCLSKDPKKRPYPKRKDNTTFIMDHRFISKSVPKPSIVAEWYQVLLTTRAP